jgi:hypothetical protein
MQSSLLLVDRKSLRDRPFRLIGPEKTFHNAVSFRATLQGEAQAHDRSQDAFDARGLWFQLS